MHFSAHRDLLDNNVSAIVSDGKHGVWVCTDNGATHVGTCVCGATVTENCTPAYTSDNAGNHTFECTTCHYVSASATCTCTRTSNNDGTHTYACDDCDYEYDENCAYTYAPDASNAGKHIGTCDCTYTVTEDCEYDYDKCAKCNYEDGNYHIDSVADLKAFRDEVNAGDDFEGKTVLLEADLDLNNEAWTPIAANVNGTQYFFQGTFDGQGFTISNLNIENVKVEAGLFGYLGVATVKNINITNVKITGNHSAGAIAGTAGYGAVIENCNVKNVEITLTPDYDESYTTSTKYDNGDDAGAIVGVLNGYAHGITSVLNCTAENVTIKGYRDLGGIVGTANASGTSEIKVTGCTVTGLSITVDQTTGYYGDKAANANGDVVGRLIGNVDTTGSTASATI
jgi:hypothetical protein